jgi:hypothetical protein
MNLSFRVRLLGIFYLLVSSGLFVFNWYHLLTYNTYWLTLCAATPMFVLISLLVIVSPRMIVRYDLQDQTGKRILLLTVIIGGLWGGVNFYAMNRSLVKPEIKQLHKIPPMPDEFLQRPYIPSMNQNKKSSPHRGN